MKSIITKWVSKTLREIADKIDSGNCELDDEQAMHIMSTIGHEAMSKDSACSYLNISRSKFDSLVAEVSYQKERKDEDSKN